MAAQLPSQLRDGFWLGLGLALAFLVWGTMQVVVHRAKGG